MLRHPTRVAPKVAALFVFTACGALAGAGERPPAAPDLSSSSDWSRKDRSKPRGAPSDTQLAASPDTPTVPPGGWPAKVTPPAGWPKRWSHPFQHVPTALPNPTTKVFDDVLPAGLIGKLHTEALLGLGRIFALYCYSPALYQTHVHLFGASISELTMRPNPRPCATAATTPRSRGASARSPRSAACRRCG